MKLHITWLDGIRCIAIMLVILTHATENAYVLNENLLNESTRYVAVLFHSLGRLGVPLFLFLTGFLLLDRRYEEIQISDFLRRKWLGLFIATISWIIIYDLFLRAYMEQHTNIGQVLKEIFFLKNVNMPHMWYMPMIIGIYLFFPFTANALQELKKYEILYFPLGVVSTYAFITPIFNEVYHVFSKGSFTYTLDIGFSGGVYGIYLIFGFLLHRQFLKNVAVRYLLVDVILTFIGVIILQVFAFSYNKVLDPWYNWVAILLCSLGVFELLSRLPYQIWQHQWVTVVSKYSFAMYLTHYPLLMILKPLLQKLFLPLPINAIILWGGDLSEA